ncbi:GNAT family N-acetyltransferase [Legionella clemsonensis]|uniref:Ribosomal-protein-alanine N-acetyltransferase n=1 Tax=Legionella clemsonensis TaxID=1867846 RepID=A0A222P6E8_9GAMM|nr:GNAT family N-acetyltransferase [Legionella clemsonensis]ASQ47345.1 ribosomal-protein-alanine N-acetyltransferase [Legionella clemsonensis]
MIICNNQVNEAQLQAIQDLSALCRERDGGTPTIYNHLLLQKRPTENNVFYFQDDQLLGFLSVYFFYEDACEVSLLIAPAHRRRGIAKQLLTTITPLLIAKEMHTLIFSSPTVINSHWLTEQKFLYRNSEYKMLRESYEPIFLSNPKLQIRKATLDDIPTLCSIDEACFSGQQENMMNRFNLLLNDSHYTLLLALHNHVGVGKAHIHWQPKGAIFSDIAILPQYQRQGWGGELLSYCINQALSIGKNKLMLDVETTNQNAINLYTRLGFKTANISDYWTIPLRTLIHSWNLL